MRLFARLEVVLDDADDAGDQPAIERICDGDVDVALWLRATVEKVADEHGTAWEADLHLEPLQEREEL